MARAIIKVMCVATLVHGQHQHNRHDQGNVEPEQLGTVQFIHFGDSFHADGLRLGGRVVARSTLFFIPGEQDTQAKDQNNSDNLCGDAIPPDLRGADFQRGGGASAGPPQGTIFITPMVRVVMHSRLMGRTFIFL